MPGMFSPSPQVSDPDMHHGTCVTHVPWCMPGSLNSGFLWNWRRGENVPGIPGACATWNFTYLVSGPLCVAYSTPSHYLNECGWNFIQNTKLFIHWGHLVILFHSTLFLVFRMIKLTLSIKYYVRVWQALSRLSCGETQNKNKIVMGKQQTVLTDSYLCYQDSKIICCQTTCMYLWLSNYQNPIIRVISHQSHQRHGVSIHR